MMNCENIQQNLIAFAEGDLSPEMRDSMKGHIANCESCSRLVEAYLLTETIIAAEKSKEPNPFLTTRILQKLENSNYKKNRFEVPALRPALIPLVLLAALVIGFFVGNYSISRKAQTSTGSNQIEVLKSDFYVHDFVDEEITLLTENN